ncbi:hypothetical protein [Bacillus sp. FJAT-42315]|uniref:hypothetical protein n=1 Tax=Bacillus sp. FJAT-42315 TaxID=2014077 RepID=UPI0012FE9140|nr:hypothetical protein [Bacillus sp. FJAT-42315]
MNIKQLLFKQKPLFIIGDNTSERYELFRSYKSPNNCLQNYWYTQSDIFKDTTWVLFGSGTQDMFILENNVIHPFEEHEVKKGGSIIWVPIDETQIPPGVVIVLPPYFMNEKKQKEYYDNSSLSMKDARFLWTEFYPYGKGDTSKSIKQIIELAESKVEVLICLIKTNRKFSASDLSSEKEAIMHARRFFVHKGFSVSKNVASMPLGKEFLKEALINRKSFSQMVLARQLETVEDLRGQVQIILEEDIKMELEVCNLVENLELCFDYLNWKSSKDTVIDFWWKEIKLFYDSGIKKNIINMLKNNYNLTLIATQKEIDKYFEDAFSIIWNKIQRDILAKKISVPMLAKSSSAHEYNVKIAKAKAIIKTTFVSALNKQLYPNIRLCFDILLKQWDELETKVKERV